ncbi:hypothetical protein [Paraflavitalea pollutisoli]|uniref:hypothetical protein n=1 Tax=Paraflavitalea pollutisoli TaxID=3034143 RepID=UPI0023EC357E|nr:hypothetical protein [Paraflavitalea sp. H1-2-19X]
MTFNLCKTSIRPLLLLAGTVVFTFLFVACGNDGHHGDGVWIPDVKDSSELAMRDHFIPKDSIEVYKKRFDLQRDTIKAKIPTLFIPFSESFNRKSILNLMKDTNCVGIRVYYGATAVRKNGLQDVRLIVVGVDKKGNDLYVRRGFNGVGSDSDSNGGYEYGQCTPPCEP